ncbi:MAG: diguanylate cyclase domain-containing protein [Acidimicrobiales bacterium]
MTLVSPFNPAGGLLADSDQFSALIDAGAAIAAALSPEAIRNVVQEHVPVVLRAQRCTFFDVRGGDSGVVAPEVSDLADDASLRALVGESVATGRVAIWSASARAAGSASGHRELRPAGAGAALCAPIVKNGRVVAGFYATRTDVAVFGDDERRVAAFIAAMAGASLEHVAGSEAHFRALARNSHDLTIVVDASGRALYVSPSIGRILGYRPSDFSQLDGEVIHPDDASGVSAAFRLCRFSPATHPTLEFRARHRDGSWRWLDLRCSNLLADPSIRGIVLNLRDITDRKTTELALAQATEEFRLSFENAPIGMAMTSIDPATAGRFLRVNQAMADMLGTTRRELEASSIWELTHPEDQATDRAAMERFLKGATTSFSTEKRYRHADGHWIWVHLQSNVVAREDHPASYVISQMLDVTERRASDERLTYLALHDPLTGLANRRLLLDRLAMALVRAGRSGRQVAVLYLDLDHFKAINDSLGHEQGDHLLRDTAARLGRLVRESDTLARLGGDEFVLIADDLAGKEDAESIARRIIGTFDQPFELPGGAVSMSTSVGIALAAGSQDPKIALRQADAAMYAAKQRGRNRFHLHA